MKQGVALRPEAPKRCRALARLRVIIEEFVLGVRAKLAQGGLPVGHLAALRRIAGAAAGRARLQIP